MTEQESPQGEAPRDNSTDGDDPKAHLATTTIGGVTFTLCRGILATFNEVGKMATSDIIQAYNSLSTVDRDVSSMKKIVQATVQLAWYRDLKGEEPPEKVLAAYDAMLKADPQTSGGEGMASGTATRKQRSTSGKKEKGEKTQRVTAADVIRNGLRRGFSDEVILKQVKEKVSTSNADERHIAYYRKKLVDAGEIKEGGRKKKVKKEEAAETE
jgi:hypothetical protein